MDRWFRHDPQAQEGFLNLGYHFLSRIPMPRKEAQVGRSCARGSNKCAKGRFLLQRPRKVPPRWGTSVPHRAGTFPHRCSEKVEDGLPKSPQNVTFRQLSCLAARKLCTNRRDGVLLRPICVAFVHGSPPGRAEKRKSIFSDFQSY